MSREVETINQIAQGEDQQQELKRLIDNPESIAGQIIRELIHLVQSAGELHYDGSPVRGADLTALSEEAFGSYYERQFGLPLNEGLRQSGLTLEQLGEELRLCVWAAGGPTPGV